MTVTARWKLPNLAAEQAQKHVTHNEALAIADAGMGATALAFVAAPIGSEADGDGYIVTTGTGAFAGWDDSFVFRRDGAWRRILPFEGMLVWVSGLATLYIFSGGDWLIFASPAEAGILYIYIATTGNDSNGTGSIGAPFLTAEKATDVAAASQRRMVAIIADDGAYDPEEVWLSVGAGQDITFIGNLVTPANVSGFTFHLAGVGGAGVLGVETEAIDASNHVRASIMDISHVGAGVHISARDYADVEISFSERVAGGFDKHLYARDNALITYAPSGITLVSTPAIGDEYARADVGGKIVSDFSSVTGSATGKRARAEALSGIWVTGNPFPGGTAGDAHALGYYDGT